MSNKIVILDGYSMLFRAFYATYLIDKEKLMRNEEGIPTNAIYAFSNMLVSILKKLNKDDSIFVALDSGKENFRKKEYKEYKANRKPIEEELRVQLPILRELLSSLNIPFYEQEGLEADDIAGNIAKKMEKENYKVIIYTSDKDYLQLIDENITINLIKKGLKDIKEMTPTSFKEEWGFDPIHIIDYKALRGDDSDNLKGIPGIGDKTAKDLIIKYHDFENIVKNADLNKKVGQNIVTYQDNGRLCLSLATIKVDDNLPLTKEDLLYKGYDYNQVNSFINKYNLKSLLSKLPANFRRINSSSDSLKSKLEYKEVSSLKEIVSILNISLNKIDSLGISILLSESNYHYADIKRIYLTLLNNNFVLSFDNFLKDKDLVSLLEDEKIKKYCFDFKKLYVSLYKYNIVVKGLAFDLMLGSYLVNVTLATSSLENILSYFNIDISFALKDNDEKESLSLFDDNYSKEDPLKVCESYYSLNLYNEITTRLKESDELNLLFDIEQPLSLVLGRMEIEGFPLNKKYLETFKSEYKSKLSSLEENIYQLVGKKFNINSPKQLASILYDELKLISPNKSRSTSVEILTKVKDKSPLIPLILEYRKYSKLLNTYVEGFIPFIDKNGLIHATFNQALTSTGRLSCSDPNLQNLSIRDDDSKAIRKAFFYDDKSLNLLSLDYSQIELRILAHLANSKTMIDVFNSGEDIHSATAKKIFHLSQEPTSDERRKAKTVNFGIVYGISDWGLSEQLGCSVSEAKEIITSFYNEFPEIKEYLNSLIDEAKEKGYSKTMFNRRRYLSNFNSESYQEREFEKRAAMNAPIQGSAADLIKIAMIEVDKKLAEKGYKARIINQIHDEIILKVNDDELNEVQALVKDVMENSVKLKTKLLAEGGAAKNWYDCK